MGHQLGRSSLPPAHHGGIRVYTPHHRKKLRRGPVDRRGPRDLSQPQPGEPGRGRRRLPARHRDRRPTTPSPPPGPPTPAGGATSRILRAECFDNLAQLIKRETDDLARLMARECGKVVTECRAEVVEGLHMIQYVFGTGRMPIGDVLASEIAEKDAFVRRKPWGVVAVITPWNFPFAVPLWMLGPTLLEGQHRRLQAVARTRPPSASGWSSCSSRPASRRARSTSSTATARSARRWCATRTSTSCCSPAATRSGSRIQQVSADFHDRIVAAEMGSKSAVIVCDDARLDLAVNAGDRQRLQDERPALRLGRPHPGRTRR